MPSTLALRAYRWGEGPPSRARAHSHAPAPFVSPLSLCVVNVRVVRSPVFAGTGIAGQAWNTLNLSSSSEDCLYVNVYAPVDATAHSQLPVLLYLHAGEFRYGTSNDAENNWCRLAPPSLPAL